MKGNAISYSESVVEPGDQVFFGHVSRFFGGFAGLRVRGEDRPNEFIGKEEQFLALEELVVDEFGFRGLGEREGEDITMTTERTL